MSDKRDCDGLGGARRGTVPELVDLAEAKLPIADDVADTGRTLAQAGRPVNG